MDKWFKDILPDKDPYHNRGRDQMRGKGGPDFKCLCKNIALPLKDLKISDHIKRCNFNNIEVIIVLH
jgi:hypothetical protein